MMQVKLFERNTLWMGGAVLMLMTTAGCSTMGRWLGMCQDSPPALGSAPADPSAVASANPSARPIDLMFDNDTAAQAPAPSINIFGEFDGQPRPSVKTVGEANVQQHTYTSEGYDSAVSVDPTGQFMVFASTRHSEKAKIYLQRVDGTAVTQLTGDDAEDAFPSISPNGKQVAFCSTRGGNWDIYLMDIDGQNVIQITNGPMQDMHPSFSPDGSRLVYCSIGGRSDQWELWTVNLNGGERRMIGYGLFPTWSPDKKVNRIAFQRARQRGSRWFSIWTLDLIDGEARRMTEVTVSGRAAVVSPSWSPDGKCLTFATIAEPSFGDKSGSQQDIWIVTADGTNRRRLTDGTGSNLTPFWAVDNRVYFISDRGGNECVWSARAEVPQTQTAQANPSNNKPAGNSAESSADTREIGH
jgi:TolB protein